MILLLFMRDLSLAFRHGGGAFATLGFYIIVFTVFAFGLGPEALHHYAAGTACVALLLALLLALPHLYERDQEDGTLEQYFLLPHAVEWVTFAKIMAYWVTHTLPCLLITPVIGAMADIGQQEAWRLTFILMLGSPGLAAAGSLAAALTLKHRGGLTRALVLLPLLIPALILMVLAVQNTNYLFVLAAWSLVMLPFSCWVTALLLRFAQE